MAETILNQFEIDGEVIQVDDDKVTIKVINEGVNQDYEELLVVTVPKELASEVRVGEMQSFAGRVERSPAEETRLMALDIQPAEEYYNFATILAKIWSVDFYKAKPKLGKKQFLNIFAREEGNPDNRIGAVAFKGLSNELKDLSRGSLLQMGGQLRRRAFADNSGRYSTDILLSASDTEIIHEQAPRKMRQIGDAGKPAKKAKKKV